MKVAWYTSGRPYTREGESTITPEMAEAQGQKTSGKAWRAALKANRVHMNPLVRAKYRLESNTFRKIEYGWDLQPNYRTHESLKDRFAYEGYWGFDPVPYAAWILTQKSYDMGEHIKAVVDRNVAPPIGRNLKRVYHVYIFAEFIEVCTARDAVLSKSNDKVSFRVIRRGVFVV